MDLLNHNGSTRMLGRSIPNIVIWLLIAVGVLLVIKIGNVLGSIFGKIKSFLGFDSTEQKDEVQQQIFKELKKDPSVQSQMTTNNAQKAQRIEEAMQGFGYDIDSLYEIFKSITGPNQMKAIHVYFGTRTIRQAYLFTHTGDLVSCVRDRLWSYQLNKDLGNGTSIATKLKWI